MGKKELEQIAKGVCMNLKLTPWLDQIEEQFFSLIRQVQELESLLVLLSMDGGRSFHSFNHFDGEYQLLDSLILGRDDL